MNYLYNVKVSNTDFRLTVNGSVCPSKQIHLLT